MMVSWNKNNNSTEGNAAPMATGALDRTTGTPETDVVESKFEYPGIPTTCDGAEAVVWVETHICQGSGAYPITSGIGT